MKHRWQYTAGLPPTVLACECGAQRDHRIGGWRSGIVYRIDGGEWSAGR